jgi:hydrogenase/urease accessory protein HupE
MNAETNPGRPRAVEVGIAAALVLAGLYLAAIPLSPFRAFPALVLLVAALGLRHGHAWAGYGGAGGVSLCRPAVML